MKSWWSQTRPNGVAIDAGTFCRVIDLEDGTHPIYTYGASVDEVLEKIERQNGNAQIALTRRSTPPPTSQPVAPRARMTADEVMQATTDLGIAGKAGEAAARLVEDATGIDLRQMALQNFVRVATAWELAHPSFYPHPGNKRMLADQAKAHTGGDIARVTAEILTQAFTELQTGGYLLEAPLEEEVQHQPSPASTPSSFPDESQVQRTERPRRSAPNYSTGIPGTRLRATQTAQPRTPKYSERQILTMHPDEYKRLWNSGDKDFREACAAYEAKQMAS